jgi:hypothetical protein
MKRIFSEYGAWIAASILLGVVVVALIIWLGEGDRGTAAHYSLF